MITNFIKKYHISGQNQFQELLLEVKIGNQEQIIPTEYNWIPICPRVGVFSRQSLCQSPYNLAGIDDELEERLSIHMMTVDSEGSQTI